MTTNTPQKDAEVTHACMHNIIVLDYKYVMIYYTIL